MLRIVGKSHLPRPLNRPIITLGYFDGVHLGHQAVIRKTIEWAKEIDGESVVITFNKHPLVVLSGIPPSSITSLEHRLILFEELGVDVCVVLDFDHQLSEVTAKEYVEKYISGWLSAQGVLLGFDCRFGKGARGNVDLLQTLGNQLGFEVRACEQIRFGNLIPSSTAIREAILSGQLEKAEAMLGRPVSIFGQVVQGKQRGRLLNFPTANLNPHQDVFPPNGVYASRVKYNGVEYSAVTNIGVRPTVELESDLTIESHLLDFEGDLYGEVIEVRFIQHLRDEKKFSGTEELKVQIKRDIKATIGLFASQS